MFSPNADGSFTNTPEANYNGTDSFTCKLNDNALDSSVATVNLSIAAVNDAPVAADVQAATAEDTPLVILKTSVQATEFTENTEKCEFHRKGESMPCCKLLIYLCDLCVL